MLDFQSLPHRKPNCSLDPLTPWRGWGVEGGHIYEESEGTHGWKWWDEHIGRAIDVMLSEK